jgi:hypothetical protein
VKTAGFKIMILIYLFLYLIIGSILGHLIAPRNTWTDEPDSSIIFIYCLIWPLLVIYDVIYFIGETIVCLIERLFTLKKIR